MKKTFGIMGTGLLLASNVLMSFSNVSFAVNGGAEFDPREEYVPPLYSDKMDGCYIFRNYFRQTKGTANSYLGTELLAYKCDAERGTVDLRDAPLESGQYIAYIGEDAFSGTNVTKVIIPSTVMGIGNRAFCSVERLGEPKCGDGVIDKELGEECDDGGKIFTLGMNDNYVCNSECRKEPAQICGNGKIEKGEDCHICPEDVGVCGEETGIRSLDENQDLENQELEEQNLENQELDGDEDLEYKGEYRETSASASLVDNSNFVVVDFPDGMNNEFNTGTLSNACAKLQEYTVTFITENGVRTGETFNQHILPFIIPEVPEKEGLIGAWYLSGEIFDFNSQITGNITLVYKYVKGGIEYDEENGWIKVSLGDQEIIIKDKNQVAEKSFNEVDTGDSSDLINAIGTYYLWGNNTGLNLKENLGDNGLVNLDEVILPGGFDHGYLGMEGGDDWTMGSNDTPCNADSGEYLPSPDEWKNLMQIRGKINGYELIYKLGLYTFNDYIVSPEFHESPQLIDEYPESTFHRAYDSEVGGEPIPGNTSIVDGTLSPIEKFLNDLYIGLLPPLYVENGGVDFSPASILFPSSLNNGRVGYLTMNGLFVFEESNLEGVENNIATPVRCFVRPQFEVSFEVNGGTDVVTQKIFSGDKAVEPEVQKENAEFLGWFTEDGTKFIFDTPITSDIKLHAEWQEKKTNSGYSGGGGGGSSSSSTAKTSDKSHNSADDKVDSTSKEKTDSTSKEKVETTSDEKTDKNQQNNMDKNQKQDKDTEPVVSNKVTYVPDRSLSENEQAYDFAHTYGITTKNSVENAKMNSPLTRIQMAKMLSQYAINVLGKEPDVSKGTVKFNDVSNNMDKSYDNGVTLSYQLGIMGQNMPNNNFRPNDEVTRAEFVSAFSRMLYNTSDGEYRSTSKYYIHHMEKLKGEGIVTNDNPSMKEKRGYVMIMLMRSVK